MRPNDDLDGRLQSWPELAPDALAMQQTALRMNNHLAVLRAASEDSLGETQFRSLMATSAALAVVAYVAWPSIADFLAENPWCEFTLLCVVILSLIAPLVLLPLLRAGRGETVLPQSHGGLPPC